MANEENTNSEIIDNQEESINQNSSATTNSENNTEATVSADEEKKSKLKKILIILVSVLLVIILIIVVLFFVGVFDKEEEKEIKVPAQTLKKELEVKEENYKFDLKSIDSKKLNEQLTQLTNQSLSEEKSAEYQKIKAERKKLEEEKKELELIKKEKEELLKQKEILEQKKNESEKAKTNIEELKEITKEGIASSENKKTDEQTETKQVENNQNTNNQVSVTEKKEIKKVENFLMFINVATIEGSLLKNFLDDLTKIDANILLCRDDINRIEVYYGPFKNEEDRKTLLNKLLEGNFKESYGVELTEIEFNKRCKY